AGRDLRPVVLGPGGALPDPRGQGRDLGFGEATLGRHAQVRVAVADRLDEQALLRVAGHENGSAVAALVDGRTAVQLQAPAFLLRGGAVALKAALGQDGADLLLEELDVRGVGGLVAGAGGRGPSQDGYRQDNQSTGRAHPSTPWRARSCRRDVLRAYLIRKVR